MACVDADFHGLRLLAASVIGLAVRDFMAWYGNPTFFGQMIQTARFLAGKTDIAQMWFDTAGLMPLTGSPREIYTALSRPVTRRAYRGLA